MRERKLSALLYPACVLACAAIPVQAAKWTTSAGVAPGITYTDNVCLSADNERGEWVGLLTPDVSIRGEGNRANVNLDALVEMNTLSDSTLEKRGCGEGQRINGDRKQFAPRLNGDADAVLLEDWLFIDVDGYIYQSEVSPFVRGGGDSLDRAGNTNTVYQYRVSPYIARRFKDVAVLDLRYTWDDQYNTESVVGDSQEQRVQMSLDSVDGARAWSWGLEGDYRKLSYADSQEREVIDPDLADNDDSELKSAQLNLAYQFNRFWQINGFYGDEWNDFVSDNDDTDGTFWDVGLRWTPTARTTVEVGNGHRFYGDSPRFLITHSHKRSQFSASYDRQLTFDRDIRQLNAASGSGDELAPPPGVNQGLSTLSFSPILDERFTLGYSFNGRRSNLRVNASQSEQKREDNGSDATYRFVTITVDRSLSRQLSLKGGLNWSEQDPKDSRSEALTNAEEWRATLGLQRNFNRNINVLLDYEYTDRQSDFRDDEYTENRITLTVRFAL